MQIQQQHEREASLGIMLAAHMGIERRDVLPGLIRKTLEASEWDTKVAYRLWRRAFMGTPHYLLRNDDLTEGINQELIRSTHGGPDTSGADI